MVTVKKYRNINDILHPLTAMNTLVTHYILWSLRTRLVHKVIDMELAIISGIH